MKLIVLILAVLAIRYIEIGRSEGRYKLFTRYAKWFSAGLDKLKLQDGWVQLVLLIAPFPVLLAIIYWLTAPLMFGLIIFIVNLLVLWYCLWPPSQEQLIEEGIIAETDVAEVVIDQNGEMLSQAKPNAQANYREHSKAILWQANQYTFAVIFWFILTAGFGAMVYRAVDLLAKLEDNVRLSTAAQWGQQCLDWLPARITALTYVIAANFMQGFHQWRNWVLKGLDSSCDMLAAVGLASMEINGKQKADAQENQQMINLTDRALIVWLSVVAIGTLVVLLN